MHIDKGILLDIVLGTLRKVRYRKDPADGLRYEDKLDFGLIEFLIRGVLMRNPVEGVKIIGKEQEWEGFPASKSLRKARPGVGIPIGDLTSQLFSNIYLNELTSVWNDIPFLGASLRPGLL